MPFLGGLFVNLFSGFVAWLTQFFTRKIAFVTAGVAAYSVLTASLFVIFRGSVAALQTFATGAPSMFVDAMSMAIPPAAPFCLSTYMVMWTGCTVYTWQRDLLRIAITA